MILTNLIFSYYEKKSTKNNATVNGRHGLVDDAGRSI